MKVAVYVHPGIFPQGPHCNDVWIDILGRLMQALRRAWIDEAPEPIVEPFSSPNGETAAELAESRRLIAAIHGRPTGRIGRQNPHLGT
jgi:hypothetical protein